MLLHTPRTSRPARAGSRIRWVTTRPRSRNGCPTAPGSKTGRCSSTATRLAFAWSCDRSRARMRRWRESFRRSMPPHRRAPVSSSTCSPALPSVRPCRITLRCACRTRWCPNSPIWDAPAATPTSIAPWPGAGSNTTSRAAAPHSCQRKATCCGISGWWSVSRCRAALRTWQGWTILRCCAMAPAPPCMRRDSRRATGTRPISSTGYRASSIRTARPATASPSPTTRGANCATRCSTAAPACRSARPASFWPIRPASARQPCACSRYALSRPVSRCGTWAA